MITEKEIEEMIKKIDIKKDNAIIDKDSVTVLECKTVLKTLHWTLGRTTTIFF